MMHAWPTRMNAVFSLVTTTMGICMAFNYLTGLLLLGEGSATLSAVRAERQTQRGIDVLVFSFDLDADLDGVYTWNTKDLFVYVRAEFDVPGNTEGVSSVVVWDQIVRHSDPHTLEVSATSEYPIRMKNLGGVRGELSVFFEVTPMVGSLWQEKLATAPFVVS